MNRRTSLPFFLGILFLIILIMAALLAALAAQKNYTPYSKSKSSVINHAAVSINGKSRQVQLPCRISTPSPGTPVVVTLHPRISARDMLYVKTVYAPLTVSSGGKILASYGTKDSYPSFMHDPATEVHFLALSDTLRGKALTLTFYAPQDRDYIMLFPPIIGKAGAITGSMLPDLVVPFALAILQLILGMFIFTLGIYIRMFPFSFDRHESFFDSLPWLGLFSFCAGVWAFCENNMTLWFVNRPAALYLLSFMALECLIIPMYMFIQSFLKTRIQWLHNLVRCCIIIAPIVSLLSQLTGILPLYRSITFFHVMIPVIMCLLIIQIILQYLHHRDTASRQLLIASCIIFLFAIAEVLNYHFHFVWQNASIFEIGLSIFIIYAGFISIGFVYRTLRDRRQMAFDMRTMKIIVKEQKKETALIMESEKEIRRQRHDLRHKLIAIKEMAAAGKQEDLQDHIATMIRNIPHAVEIYCENPEINAIVSYYLGLYREHGISAEAHLAIPAAGEKFEDVDLCVVFGNLMENALEACQRMKTGDRFVRLQSTFRCGTLTITMDNSFNGQVHRAGDLFYSSKRNERGIGLSSILSIARKYNGNAHFEAKGSVFYSSLYLQERGDKTIPPTPSS